MSNVWHQQAFALDAKYNGQRASKLPTLGMLYIRRRNQLLREKGGKEAKIRERYLRLRSRLLQLRYGEISGTSGEQSSLAGEEERSDGRLEYSQQGKHTRGGPTLAQSRSTAEGFAFAGVHDVFEIQSNAPVTMLRFANNDRSRLCYSSLDGSLGICDVDRTPITVLAVLEGHRAGVTAFDWSISNDLIVSGSLDATVRLWSVDREASPACLRVINDHQNSQVLCCAFIPVNNNLVVTGNSHGIIQVLNISTGIYLRGGSCKLAGNVLSLACQESGGSVIWAGNDRGTIASYQLDPGTGRLSKLQRVLEIGERVTNMSWRSWLSKNSPWPALLVSSPCNAVLLYRVTDHQGSLSLWRKYPINHRRHTVRATFSPQLGASLIATGSDDGSVQLLDAVREGKYARINDLHGHAAPTLALSFNYDESLLVSADYQGLIIVWRNAQRCS